MVTIQPVPPAHEPPVVARMAKQLSTYKEEQLIPYPYPTPQLLSGPIPQAMTFGDLPGTNKFDTYGGTIFKLALVGGALILFGLSYRGCVQRGACKGFF